MSATVGYLLADTDHVIEIPALSNGLTDEVVAGATVTVTVLDSDGAEVSGQSWPTAMAEDDPGQYYATLSAAMDVTVGATYKAKVIADAGTGLKRTWYLPLLCVEGGFPR
jgi:hypothetical protein